MADSEPEGRGSRQSNETRERRVGTAFGMVQISIEIGNEIKMKMKMKIKIKIKIERKRGRKGSGEADSYPVLPTGTLIRVRRKERERGKVGREHGKCRRQQAEVDAGEL